MKDFTTAGPMEGPRIHVELEPVVKDSLTTDLTSTRKDSLQVVIEPDLLSAVDAFVDAIRADDLKATRQTFFAMIDAADVARGEA
jgi:hypothetical protein